MKPPTAPPSTHGPRATGTAPLACSTSLLGCWPADLLGLLVGHQLDFFLGDAANLRDRVGRSLPHIDQAHPHHGYAQGMYAFGLEESGDYPLAEHHGLAAVDRNRDDVWATHAVTHVYEMQGRIDEGIRFLRTRQADWGEGNLFAVHNWWHLALYLLEAGDTVDSLAIYDRHIHNEQSAGVPLEMLDASALLWRLHLDRVDVGGRFDPLADAWATRTTHEPWYVFNDLHAVMALAGAGRTDEARAVIDRLAAYVAAGPPASNVRMTAEVGLPACRSVLAHVEESPRRRRRRADADPHDPRPFRRLARPARRAAAHTRRRRPSAAASSNSPAASSTNGWRCARPASGRGSAAARCSRPPATRSPPIGPTSKQQPMQHGSPPRPLTPIALDGHTA